MIRLIYLLVSFCSLIALDLILSKTNLPLNEEFYLLGFEKFRAHATETLGQRRIILVGGSSLGWGVSAEKLSSELDQLTLNSGMYAGIGYKNFFRVIEDVIDKDKDILVISPEYEIISEVSKSRNEDFCYLSIYVNQNYPLECLGYTLSRVVNISAIIDRLPSPDYRRSGFNAFGDYVYRSSDEVDMAAGVFEESCSTLDLADLVDEYIPFIKDLESDGYEVVYIPNFLADGACRQPEKLNQFHQALFNEFGIDGFEKSQLLYSDSLFYNTRYHLTQKGVEVKTKVFEDHLRQYLANRK